MKMKIKLFFAFLLISKFACAMEADVFENEIRAGLTPARLAEMQREMKRTARHRAEHYQQIRNDLQERQAAANRIGNDAEAARLSKRLERYDRQEEQVDQIALGVIQQFTDIGGRYADNVLNRQTKREEIVLNAGVTARENNKGAMEQLKEKMKFMRENAGTFSLLAGGTVVGTIGGYYAFRLGYNYFNSLIGKPTLVRESSKHDWKQSLKNFWSYSILGKEKVKETLSDVIFTPAMAEKMQMLADDARNTMENGLPFRHALFYGLPGTGKTMFAKRLAKYSGMDYAIMSGADFSQFKDGEGITELHKLFDWAEKSKYGLLIFIDEADAFLRDRRVLSNEDRNLVNAFLSRTGSGSDKYMLVFATNYEDELDPAVLSRINKKVNFHLPEFEERNKIFNLYFDKYILNDERTVNRDGKEYTINIELAKDVTKQVIDSVAQKANGFSGRELEQLVSELRVSAYNVGQGLLSKKIIDDAAAEKVAEHKHDMESAKIQRERQQAALNRIHVAASV